MYVENEIETLSDFFAVFHSLLDSNKTFWFRGHPQVGYRLAPSALRYNEEEDRALELVADMKRFLEPKLPRPPASDDDLGWMQVAQHYGLPTRLLRLQARGRILKVKTSGHRPPLTPLIRLNSQDPGRVLGHLTPNCGRPVAARSQNQDTSSSVWARNVQAARSAATGCLAANLESCVLRSEV